MLKVSRTLLATEGFMALVLALYFSAFPIFNEIPGSDFGVHLAFSRDIAQGVFPSLSSALLYQGVEFYLAIGQILFPSANPFVVVRLSMALLVFVSPLIVYLCSKEIFEDDFKAKMAALVYAVTGWIWVEWVLVTGLYANFYGFLASLFLVAAILRFDRNQRQFRYLTSGPNIRRNFSYSVTKELIRNRLSRSLKVTLRRLASVIGLILYFPPSLVLNQVLPFIRERALAAFSYVLYFTRASQTSISQSENPWNSIELPRDFLRFGRTKLFLVKRHFVYKPTLNESATVRTNTFVTSHAGQPISKVSNQAYFPRQMANRKWLFDFLLMLLATVNALFSHYSTLLVFPPLLVYLAYKRSLVGLSVLLAPLVAGLALFPGLVSGIGNFLAPTTVVSPGSSVLPSFSLSALDAELTDYGFAFLMLGAVAFAWLAFKKKDSKLFLLLAWFILPLVVAPLNSSAWRFAFISLVPGTLMLGYVLGSIPKFPLTTRKGVNHKNFYRTLLLIGLVTSPTFYPSWAYLAFTHSLQADPQQGVYDAVRWIGTNIPTPPVCHSSPTDPHCSHIVSVDDWRLTYAPLFNGSQVLYGPDYGVLWEDPLQTQLFALNHNSHYIAVSKDSTFALPACDPRYSFGLTLSADTTTAKPNQTIILTLGAIQGLNATASLFDNGVQAATVQLVKGHATVEASFPHDGNHSLVLSIGSTATLPLNLSIGPYSASIPSTVSVPSDFCTPWRLYSSATMQGWIMVYNNTEVAIWRYGK